MVRMTPLRPYYHINQFLSKFIEIDKFGRVRNLPAFKSKPTFTLAYGISLGLEQL